MRTRIRDCGQRTGIREGVGAGHRDVVHDFEQGEDRLALSLHGIGTPMPGSFIGKAAFTGANQVRYRHQDGDTIVQGDSDSDMQADIEILLKGHLELTSADLSLI